MSKQEIINVLATALEDAKRDLENTGGDNALQIIKRALKFLDYEQSKEKK